MKKPYKSKPPVETINKIRNILNCLGIVVQEEYSRNNQFHSCRISMINDDLKPLNIGTNGKGRTVEYAFASAYAEFMERLQNNILLKHTIYASDYFITEGKDSFFYKRIQDCTGGIPYVFEPNEQYINSIEVISRYKDLLGKLLQLEQTDQIENAIINQFNFQELICIPFYHPRKNKIEHLPIELIMHTCGSTGMCAGNDSEEAMIQGICEIFERYVGREIYTKKLTPPTIPHDYFRDDPIFNTLKILEAKGLSIIVKDFSLGKGIPVIGILVTEKGTNTYNVKIGSDPNPIIALERCLTELHQSLSGVRLISKKGFGDYLGLEYQDVDREVADYINMRKIFTNATGQWPDSIFSENSSYEFKGLDFSHSESNKTDLLFLTDLIEKLGYDLYVRDVSYLGFHSFYMVIPGLSQGKIKHENNFILYDFYSKSRQFNKINSLSPHELEEVAIALEKNGKLLKIHGLNFSDNFLHNNSEELKELDQDLFLCMLFYKLRKYSKAINYMDRFLSNKDPEAYIYFFACRDFIYFKSKKISKENANWYLMKLYPESLINEVSNDLENPDAIFDYYELPNCFNCENCKAIDNCKYFEIIKIVKKIQILQTKNKIDPFNLSTIFHSTTNHLHEA